MSKRLSILALCAAATLACKSQSKQAEATKPLVGGIGKKLVGGHLSDLRVTPDYRFATFLKDAEKPIVDGISPKLRVGELDAVSLTNGDARKLGDGVTNAPGGYLFSPDSRWVVLLEGYNPASGAGEAKAVDLTRPEAKPVALGHTVTFFTFSPDSKWVAVVDDAVLRLGPVGGELRALGGEVSTAGFSADGRYLVFRRKLSAGAALMVAKVATSGDPVKVADGVVDYVISPDSARVAFTVRDAAHPDVVDLAMSGLARPAAKKVAEGTNLFAFSPDGKWLGRTEGFSPGDLGKLVVGPADGSGGKVVGERVQAFQFAPDSKAVAALTQWIKRSSVGKLTVATLPDFALHTQSERARDLTWDPTGRYVAYSAQVLKPLIAIDLFVYALPTQKARKVGDWVYGWSFAPQDHYLLFRTECEREGRACDLDALDLTQEAPAKKLLSAVYTFQPSADAKRLLFTYARMDSETYDAATYQLATKDRLTLDERTLLPPLFASEDGKRSVYIIAGVGLFLATAPR